MIRHSFFDQGDNIANLPANCGKISGYTYIQRNKCEIQDIIIFFYFAKHFVFRILIRNLRNICLSFVATFLHYCHHLRRQSAQWTASDHLVLYSRIYVLPDRLVGPPQNPYPPWVIGQTCLTSLDRSDAGSSSIDGYLS